MELDGFTSIVLIFCQLHQLHINENLAGRLLFFSELISLTFAFFGLSLPSNHLKNSTPSKIENRRQNIIWFYPIGLCQYKWHSS